MVVYTHEEFMKMIEGKEEKDYPEENINLPPEKRKPKKKKK